MIDRESGDPVGVFFYTQIGGSIQIKRLGTHDR